MRISQKTEWILIAVLVAYIAFTPGVQAVRDLLSTGVGKALYLAAVVATWKFVSPLVSILLIVNFVRCASMREFMEDMPPMPTEAGATPPPNTTCPEGYSFESGQCVNKNTGASTPLVVVTPPPAAPAAPATPPPAAMPPPPSTSSTTTKQPFTLMTPGVFEGFQPNSKDDKYAPA